MIEYYTGRYDNISGFAIDRTVMDSLLLKWLGGNYLDIIGWKENSKNWDLLCIDKDLIPTWKEKAQKWDESSDLLISHDKVQEWREKAHYCETHHSTKDMKERFEAELETNNVHSREHHDYWFYWCKCGHHRKNHTESILEIEGSTACLDGYLIKNKQTGEFEQNACKCRKFVEIKRVF
jgi:hypothetical protein